MNNIRRIDPYIPNFMSLAVKLFGKRSKMMCEPSRGGIGSRLKKNKKIFKKTPYQQKFNIKCLSPEPK
jgi:hypothetical protein